jgi:Domain of unknown function (DUF4382)
LTRFIRILSAALLVIAGAAGFGLVTSCNIMGGGSNATGGLNLFLTDAPTDEWEQVTVVLKSISMHRSGSKTWENVWTADPANPAAGTVNLVDLNAVAELLKQSATIPVGTYDRMMIVINTDPTTMTLIPDGSTTAIPAANITVIDPGGKGEIKIDLDPAIVVEEGKDTNLMVDFDLAHPLSIVNVDGKVVLSLKVRHKALPRHLNEIQFARTIGNITAAATDLTSFTIKTLRETDVTFKVSANTAYYDVDNKTAGSFSGLSALVGTGAALVASNMNADGSLFARRVWYATAIDLLPQFTPEGLVRRVGDTWLSIIKKNTEAMATNHDHHRCEWNSETVFVDANTKWTFQDIEMGTGTDILHFIARGFRVEVTFQNVDVYPHVAATINVRSAHAEGLIVNPTLEGFGLGWWRHVKTMYYSGVTDHTFGWWFYGEDYARSTDVQTLIDAVGQAQQAHLWVFAWAGLYWDQIAGRWAVENLVLAPLKLHDFSKITTGYTAETGSMVVSTFDCWDEATPTDMTLKLDKEGDLQTVVGSFVWNSQTNVMTFTLPVAPDRWPNVLTPDVNRVKIWVRPVKEDTTYSWHAYTVLAYTFVR